MGRIPARGDSGASGKFSKLLTGLAGQPASADNDKNFSPPATQARRWRRINRSTDPSPSPSKI